MSKLFVTPINLGQLEIQNGVIQNLAAAPASPKAGQIYYSTADNRPYYWNATANAWQWKSTDSDMLNGQGPTFYLSRSNHTGTQVAATISNLIPTVTALTLDQFSAPAAALNFNGQRITNIGAPTGSNDATTKAYVDSMVQGLTPKPSANVATAAALPANTYNNGAAGVGATLTATANAALTVDGYVVQAGDLVLVKNEATAANNGLYVVTNTGSASAAWVLTRHVDMDQTNEFGGGFVPVKDKGATTANTLWLCESAASITVGTTAVSFTQLNSPTQVTGGNGISVAGNVISAVTKASGGLAVDASGISLDTAIAVRKYAAAIGDGSTLAIAVNHNLNTQDVTVTVYATSAPYAEIECDVNHTSANQVTVTFATAPANGAYRVVVHG